MPKKPKHKAPANADKNAKGVMVYTDIGDGKQLYYLHPDDLKKFPMPAGSPGSGEGQALVDRGVVLSAVRTDAVPVGSFSTLVNIAALRRK